MTQRGLWQGAALGALMVVSGYGCAQEVGDIDRTQPNKVRKADFDEGEYFYRQQVVDTDVQGSVIFQGFYGDLKRIRWVTTEDTLFACSTLAPIDGERIEQDYIQGKECHGVVAAFPIEGHFDIQRDYNAATGEQMNTIGENTTDRPWYNREYMRVDWSTNLIAHSVKFGSFTYHFEPSGYSEDSKVSWSPDQDPGYADPYRTRIRPEEGYMETSTVYNTDPDYDACYGLSGQMWSQNCTGGQVTVMHSFLKVPEEQTFEPFVMRDNEFVLDESGKRVDVANLFDGSSGSRAMVECTDDVERVLYEEEGDFAVDRCSPLSFDYFTRFGYFRTERMKFDTNYGSTDEGRAYYANHFQIWKTAYDESGALISVSEREPQPVVFYLNAEYPRDMLPVAEEVERQWDEAFTNAAAVAKGVEPAAIKAELAELYDGDDRMYRVEHNACMPTRLAPWLEENAARQGADRADVSEILDRYLASSRDASAASMQDKLWGLPVEGLKGLCSEIEWATEGREPGERFDWEREGDLRYSFFSWVEEEAPWLGYGPSSADPETGRIISAGAHLSGGLMRRYAYIAADRVRFMNGELTDEELLHGDHIRGYVDGVRERATETMSQALNTAGKVAVTERVLGPNSSLSAYDVSPTGFTRRPNFNELPEFVRETSVRQIKNNTAAMTNASIAAERADTRLLDFYARPEVRSRLLKDPQMNALVEAAALEQSRGGPVDEEARMLAYQDIVNPKLAYWRQEELSTTFGEHNMLMASDFSRAIDSLITYAGVGEKFRGKPREELAKFFLDRMSVGTQLHEVGHTVGLRHNFSASMDALNYHDEFWKIQKAMLEGKIDSGLYIPAEKAKEILGEDYRENFSGATYLNETEFRLASVMDYTGDLTADFGGLGKYDQAAINFVYSRAVERWTMGDKLPANLDTTLWLAGYQELPAIFSGMDADEDDTKRAIAGIDNILSAREWVPIDQARAELLASVRENAKGFASKSFTRANLPAQDLVVPYNFCSDERRGRDLGCDVFDWGSSHREIVNHQFNTYRILQPFYRYRRGRLHERNETINGYANFVVRTFQAIERPFRYFSYFRNWDLGAYTDDLREASIDAANFYGEVLATPEPGKYCLRAQDNKTFSVNKDVFYNVDNTYLPARFSYDDGECQDSITLRPGGLAQYYNYELSDEYNYRINYVGTFIDKLFASIYFFNVRADFLYSNVLTDDRATNVSYWTLYKDEMLGMLRGTILNDYSTFGGVHDPQQGARGNYVPPIMIERDAYTHGTPPKQDGKPHIYSTLSFNHEFNMLAYALITNSSYEDRHTDFAQYIRVGVGDIEAGHFGGAELAEFVHPVTAQRYVAPQTADGKSLTVELIGWANELTEKWLEAEMITEQLKRTFDERRDAYSADFDPSSCDGTTEEELAFVCSAMIDFQTQRATARRRSERIEDVVAKIELIRWLWGVIGPSARF